jgi:hypothetical protein
MPANLKLEDEELLGEEPELQNPHQLAPVDDFSRSSIERTRSGPPRAVFERPGLAPGDAQLTVPVVAFAEYPFEDDLNDEAAADDNAATATPPPPPPPPSVSLDDRVFGLPLRLDVLQTVVKWQLACRRRGTGSSKRIGSISGSGKKMRPQKGTGQARAGHKRPPHWRGELID